MRKAGGLVWISIIVAIVLIAVLALSWGAGGPQPLRDVEEAVAVPEMPA